MPKNQALKTEQMPPIPSLQGERRSVIPALKTNSSKFSPNNFFIPGWNGESLTSKAALSVQKTTLKLINDAKEQFATLHGRNKSMKLAIYNEFLAYINHIGENCHELDNYSSFWANIYDSESQYSEILNKFKEVYCYRGVVTYLLKVRFFVLLSNAIGNKAGGNDLLNPNSSIGKIFKTASSTQLNCESLRSNQYSWYRPSALLENEMSQLADNLNSLSITEMMKCCHSVQKDEKQFTSHSLSHKAYGLLNNLLMIHFPEWIANKNLPPELPIRRFPKVLNTKFVGQNLKAIGQSHWLAQETNMSQMWKEILCPDFIEDDFTFGHFAKIKHELEFLSFMVYMSQAQGYHPVHIICSTMKEKYLKRNIDEAGQMSMFGQAEEAAKELIYDRVMLNITTFPKKNPHHYLLSKINSLHSSLSKDGFAFVFSNQKLFVPSQSEKVEQLLNIFKIEAQFNFEGLKGKGEIPNYLYIFTKRPSTKVTKELYTNFSKLQKESCLNFKWDGNLTMFSKFQKLVTETENFFQSKNAQTTPIYQSEIEENLTFEFHQDAILEGKLLSSQSSDSSQVTHPKFFRNLTKSSVPMDQFFVIDNINENESNTNKRQSLTSDLLGITYRNEDKYPLVLIVDYSNEADIKLELASMETYKAKLEQYGIAYYQYFGLIPKRTDININIFREFFNTSIGKQIVQISLNGGLTKMKSKLKALLIPKFFLFTNEMPKHLEVALDYFQSSKESFLASHPEELRRKFETAQSMIKGLAAKYPWQVMCELSQFKHQLEQSLLDIESKENEGASIDKESAKFNNPLIIENLLKVETYDIYPKNEEIFISTPIKDPALIHSALTECRLSSQDDNHSLELISNGEVIVALYSELNLLKFIKFIVSSTQGSPISDLLQNLSVPAAKDINNVLDTFELMNEVLRDQLTKVHQLIQQQLAFEINRDC
jgi:hypothetical protein